VISSLLNLANTVQNPYFFGDSFSILNLKRRKKRPLNGSQPQKNFPCWRNLVPVKNAGTNRVVGVDK
jgi:hypothetical protein